MILEVRGTRTGALLWSRRFEQQMAPIDYDGSTMVLRWPWSAEIAKTMSNDPAVATRLHGEKGDYVLEVVDAATGAVRGRVLVAAGRNLFWVLHAYSAGNRVFVEDSRGRALVYNLQDGSLTGHVYGWLWAVAGDGSRFCVQPKRGHLVVYDAATLEKVDEFSFASPMSAVDFRGNRLVVVTSDQTVYGLGLP